jgi:NADH dehydrogenase
MASRQAAHPGGIVSATAANNSYQVLVVGAGFAGVAIAERLAANGVHVLLVDRNDYHQFQPLLYQAATAQIPVSDVGRPLRVMFRKRRRVSVQVAEVRAIDPQARRVTLTDGTIREGQVLVLACGAQPNFFDTPGAEQYAYPLYSVQDAIALGGKLLAELDAADTAAVTSGDAGLSVVVVGAGPTGVETAGAIAETFRYVVPDYFSHRFANSCAVHLVDMAPSVLTAFGARSQRYAEKRLGAFGVRVKLGVGVSEVRADGVTLADGTRIDAKVVVWAGGLKAGPLLGGLGLPQGRGGRIDVEPDLTVTGLTGVYVVGDAANITDARGEKLPQLAAVAQQAGRWAARNIQADLDGRPRQPFRYVDKGIMAMIGRGASVAELGRRRRQIQGPVAFLAWLGVHAALLPGTWQRVSAVAAWIVDFCTHHRPQVLLSRPHR